MERSGAPGNCGKSGVPMRAGDKQVRRWAAAWRCTV